MKQHFQEQERIVNTPKRHNQHFPTYRPFGHHWFAGTSTCSLLRLNLLFVAILLFFRFTLCSRRIFLLLFSTHRIIVAFPQFVLIFAAKHSAIILGVQNAAAAVWFGSTHGGSNKASAARIFARELRIATVEQLRCCTL